MQSNVNKIIANNGLKPGDAMKDVKGEDIPNSVVLGTYQVLIGDDNGNYYLTTENALSGDETVVRLSGEALNILRQFA